MRCVATTNYSTVIMECKNSLPPTPIFKRLLSQISLYSDIVNCIASSTLTLPRSKIQHGRQVQQEASSRHFIQHGNRSGNWKRSKDYLKPNRCEYSRFPYFLNFFLVWIICISSSIYVWCTFFLKNDHQYFDLFLLNVACFLSGRGHRKKTYFGPCPTQSAKGASAGTDRNDGSPCRRSIWAKG